MRKPTFARRNTTYDIRTVFNHLLGVERALRTGKSLNYNLGVFIN